VNSRAAEFIENVVRRAEEDAVAVVKSGGVGVVGARLDDGGVVRGASGVEGIFILSWVEFEGIEVKSESSFIGTTFQLTALALRWRSWSVYQGAEWVKDTSLDFLGATTSRQEERVKYSN